MVELLSLNEYGCTFIVFEAISIKTRAMMLLTMIIITLETDIYVLIFLIFFKLANNFHRSVIALCSILKSKSYVFKKLICSNLNTENWLNHVYETSVSTSFLTFL